MIDLFKLKSLVLTHIHELLDEKIDSLTVDIASTIEARNNDTKSSAGDKFETGRQMMQMELDKNEAQLNKTIKNKHDLSQIDTMCTFSKVEFGSLVRTNSGMYFISLALGKVTIKDQDVYCISLASPIGQAMMHKYEKENIDFQGKQIEILQIA